MTRPRLDWVPRSESMARSVKLARSDVEQVDISRSTIEEEARERVTRSEATTARAYIVP